MRDLQEFYERRTEEDSGAGGSQPPSRPPSRGPPVVTLAEERESQGVAPLRRQNAVHGEEARAQVMGYNMSHSSDDDSDGEVLRSARDEGRPQGGGDSPQEVGTLDMAEEYNGPDPHEAARGRSAEGRLRVRDIARELVRNGKEVDIGAKVGPGSQLTQPEPVPQLVLTPAVVAQLGAALAPHLSDLVGRAMDMHVMQPLGDVLSRLDRLEQRARTNESLPLPEPARSGTAAIMGTVPAPSAPSQPTYSAAPQSLACQPVISTSVATRPVSLSMAPSYYTGPYTATRGAQVKISVFEAKTPAHLPFERSMEVERWLRQIETLVVPPTDANRVHTARVSCAGAAYAFINSPATDATVTWAEFRDLVVANFKGKHDPANSANLRKAMRMTPPESPLGFLERVKALIYNIKKAAPETIGGADWAILETFIYGLPKNLRQWVAYDGEVDPERVAMKAQRIWMAGELEGPPFPTRQGAQRAIRGSARPRPLGVAAGEEVATYDQGSGPPPDKWCAMHDSPFHSTEECKNPDVQCHFCHEPGHVWRICQRFPKKGGGRSQPPPVRGQGRYPGGPPGGGRRGGYTRGGPGAAGRGQAVATVTEIPPGSAYDLDQEGEAYDQDMGEWGDA